MQIGKEWSLNVGVYHRRIGSFDLYKTRTINQKTFGFAKEFGARNKVINHDCCDSSFCWHCGLLVSRVLIRSNCLCPGVQSVQLVTDTKIDDLWKRPLKQIVAVAREEGEYNWCTLASCGSNTIRVEFDQEIVSMGVSPEYRTNKVCGRFNEGIRWWSGHLCGVEHKLH